ncbi:mechanosensitive ion channel [Pseudidiomarina gelatinasegens]|jgi:small-conductance mechanosensitive channel|uniref:Mechanosensitive ion channel n=1 Tax=Pseudidiomarina gelatinasegens TaxID=2487740 RepID=A0A451GEL3_9GAMM|nr:mechanosensitive ion channel domain-containing protein [Pseudidiomarina gelatinasegens]RWU11525.1 mechanosensitive ion channel [Pseudidiomarina gelatinasegens]
MYTDSLTNLFSEFQFSEQLLRPVISTLILIAAIVIARAILAKFIRKSVRSTDLRRRWFVHTRNALLLLMVVGLMLIWAEELRTLALGIVAIAVAFVVATKELIMCLTGSLVKSSGSAFSIGDRIQIKDFRGDVIDQNLLTTTILEVGPGKHSHQRTGRMISIPNSLFVSEPVTNESYTHDFVLHVFTVPFKREDNWHAAQQALLEAANRHCSDYVEQARRYMQRMSDHRGIDVPSADPRVTISVPAAGEIHLIVRFPTKSGTRSFMEQTILNDVFLNNDFTSTAIKELEQQNPDN